MQRPHGWLGCRSLSFVDRARTITLTCSDGSTHPRLSRGLDPTLIPINSETRVLHDLHWKYLGGHKLAGNRLL